MALGLVAGGMAVANAAGTVQPKAIAPQIGSVDPGFGGPGDVIAITGTGLTDDGVPATVTFLSTPATVLNFTDSELSVVVPVIPDPPDGFVELRVSNSAGFDVAPFRYYANTPEDVSKPRGLKARPTKGKVTLRWAPPSQGSELVTSYQWRAQIQRGKWTSWKTVAKGADARVQIVKRIRPKKVYRFQVRAIAGTVAGPAATTRARGR